MKKRILLTTLVATMVASALLVGCGGKEEDKDNNADNSTNVDAGTKEEEDETSYVEKYLEEPDWEKIYKVEAIPKYKFQYEGKKFVFEDMTQKFKNKESIVITEDITIYGMTKEDGGESVICDVINTIPKDTETLIYDRETYTEFVGFNVDKVEVYNVNLEKKSMMVTLYANDMMINDFYTCPMFLKAIIGCNDDGTFFYKTIEFVYDIAPTKVNN